MKPPRPWRKQWRQDTIVIYGAPQEAMPIGARVAVVPHTMYTDAEAIADLIIVALPLLDACCMAKGYLEGISIHHPHLIDSTIIEVLDRVIAEAKGESDG
jgi:hypothetical protein